MNLGGQFTQGSARTVPNPSEPSTQSGSYDGIGFDYEGKVWGDNDVRVSPTYLNALRLKYCLQDLSEVRGKVLEVGCGAGGMAKAIKAYRPDLEVYGCDISRRAIRAAADNSSGVTFELGDAYDLPFRSGNFSAVVMFDVLEHLEDPRSAVAEVWQLLKDGSLFHLFVPCEGALYTLHGLLARVGWRAKEKYGGHIQRFTLPVILELLESCGFIKTTSRWSCHLINQVADVAYFTGLSLRGHNTRSSLEGFLEKSDRSLFRSLLAASKAGVAAGSYFESTLIAKLPGSGAHLQLRKRESVSL